MKNNPYHGNRLRSPEEAYEIKKKRSRDRYAATQLRSNPFWLHNKILRNLANLYGLDTEIPYVEFISLGFDFKKFKSKNVIRGYTVNTYDNYGIYFLPTKNLCICKINI